MEGGVPYLGNAVANGLGPVCQLGVASQIVQLCWILNELNVPGE